ncbi:hypothetical protein GCM10025783_21750 [Amnibacterium soli]|uniref:AB hydrolase-1 domain-containing protein n=1 Tax=Amnibacterium soli TaxID=1282736 RepID=A0ABP8Z816_9MICO
MPWVSRPFKELARELSGMTVPESKRRLQQWLQEHGPGGIEQLARGAADQHVLERPGLRSRTERMLQHAAEQGSIGLADDLLSSLDDDWGFDLDAVTAPTLLVYGAKDPIVPSTHGRWFKRRLRNASPTLAVLPRAGHMVIAPAWQRILQHVDPQHGDRSDV